jgi:hypothetical protein
MEHPGQHVKKTPNGNANNAAASIGCSGTERAGMKRTRMMNCGLPGNGDGEKNANGWNSLFSRNFFLFASGSFVPSSTDSPKTGIVQS